MKILCGISIVIDFSFCFQMIKLLKGLLPKEEKDLNILANILQKIYVFSLMWSIGAFMEVADRRKFEEYLRARQEYMLDLPMFDPAAGSIFDYYVDAQGRSKFEINIFRCTLSVVLIKPTQLTP